MSVVSVVSIGEGVKQQVGQQIDHLGKDLITVRPGQLNAGGSTVGNLTLLTQGVTGALSNRDVEVAAKTEGVEMAVPFSVVAGNATGDHRYENGVVIGTTENLPAVLNQEVEYGGFFGKDDHRRNVAVIGAQVAQELFDDRVPLGQSFEFRGRKFQIRGIMKEFESPPLSIDANFNKAIFIPIDVAQELTANSSVYEVLVKPQKADDTPVVVQRLINNLLKAHGGEHDFTVLKQTDSLRATSNILNLMTKLISGVAAISLLVGGIGIMNVMLVSVTERMHEIGIRKAVGATNRQILNQFVMEATVLSFMGGVIGIILSLLLNLLLRAFTNLEPVISWQVVLLATGVSLAVGVLFGSAPALKAARKDPINALRNE
jgi:putative ABC transport system permease protein